jgi:hypothetical protein
VFAKITARPAAGVDNHRFVRILTAPRPALPPPPEARPDDRRQARDRPASKGRRQP